MLAMLYELSGDRKKAADPEKKKATSRAQQPEKRPLVELNTKQSLKKRRPLVEFNT